MSEHGEPRYDRKRGRHKKRRSRETLAWERDHLPPPRPPWLPDATAQMLEDLRSRLDPLSGPS